MVPIVSFVGKSNSGKTTYLTKLIPILKKRGYKIAVIKHHHGDFEIDHPGKDSWLHARAGADIVMISSPTKMAMIQKLERELPLEELVGYLNVDLVITEGYKQAKAKKVEILRSSLGRELMCAEEDLFAVITDLKQKFSVPTFDFQNVNQFADFLVANIMPNKNHEGGKENL